MKPPAKRDPRELDLGPVRLSATSVNFLSRPTLEEWGNVMEFVERADNAVQWWVGDLINAGENMFGEEASQWFSDATWRRWAWVCEKVQPALRRADLSFTHHEVIARLEPREQKHWLAQAAQHGWSVSELRKQLKGEEPPDDSETCPACGRKLPKEQRA